MLITIRCLYKSKYSTLLKIMPRFVTFYFELSTVIRLFKTIPATCIKFWRPLNRAKNNRKILIGATKRCLRSFNRGGCLIGVLFTVLYNKFGTLQTGCLTGGGCLIGGRLIGVRLYIFALTSACRE